MTWKPFEILQKTLEKIRSPLYLLGNSQPYYLAKQLLDEIDQDMIPVWPTTEHYADVLIEGMTMHLEERYKSVVKACLMAPDDSVIDWKSRFTQIFS